MSHAQLQEIQAKHESSLPKSPRKILFSQKWSPRNRLTAKSPLTTVVTEKASGNTSQMTSADFVLTFGRPPIWTTSNPPKGQGVDDNVKIQGPSLGSRGVIGGIRDYHEVVL